MKKIKSLFKNAKILTVVLAVVVDVIYYANPKVFELARLEVKKTEG